MNEKLITKLKDTNKTIYMISKESGIPYTTLHELYCQKTHINKCAADTVLILSLYLNCDIRDLLDPTPLIANSCGTYLGIKYQWKRSVQNKMELHAWIDGCEQIIDSGGAFNQPRFYQSYANMTQMLIETHLETREAERRLYG